MQKVSLEQLKMLLPDKPAVIKENDDEIADGFSFKALCDEYYHIKLLYPENDPNFIYRSILKTLYRYVPPIALVGEGSSRTVFACKGGRCVKIATNDAGIAQNRQEYKHTAKHWWKREYKCFAQTYAKSPGYELLFSECCAPIKTHRQFFDSLGIEDLEQLGLIFIAMSNLNAGSMREMTKMLTGMNKRQNGIVRMGEYIFGADVFNRACKWLTAIVDGEKNTPGTKIIEELCKFWKKYGAKELIPCDIARPENWGFAIRYGKISPVVIDAGFSTDIANAFYR